MTTVNYQETTSNIQQLSNLSTRKLWIILTDHESSSSEQIMTAAVRRELTRRNALSFDQKFTQPH